MIPKLDTAFCLLIFLNLVNVSWTEICLTAPYVNNLRAEVNSSSNLFNITILLQLDYGKYFKVENVVLDNNLNISSLSKPLISESDVRLGPWQQGVNHKNNIIAMTSNGPLQFITTADGVLAISKVENNNGTIVYGASVGYYMAGMPKIVSRKSLFESEFCKQEMAKRKDQLELLMDDYVYEKPFRTLTRWGPHYFMGRYRNWDENVASAIWYRANNSVPWEYRLEMDRLKILSRTGSVCFVRAMSATEIDYPDFDLKMILSDCSEDNNLSITSSRINIETLSGSYRPPYMSRFVPPYQSLEVQDITHWTTCRKLVTFFTEKIKNPHVKFVWMYSNYDYSQLSNLTQFVGGFSHPINHLAVHAEGDEFWFVVKATTVVMFKAIPDCSGLKFENERKVLNVRQLFNPLAKSVMFEGRYFDGREWNPKWDYVLPIGGGGDKIAAPTYTLLYVTVGIGAAAFSIIILLFGILKFMHRERGEVIYSKQSRQSLDQPNSKLHDTGREQHQTPPPPNLSEMPLFSEHDNHIKTIDSRNLKLKTLKSKMKRSKSPAKRNRPKAQRTSETLR